ncbi:Potassium channel protein [Planococcus halocryophilus Or1]|uniref:Potassium channel protein n=1 Tax=Planococcus halocryophilus TaxID=1215089 RepID=A0A1C7DST3_9BACL|nr:potassium channel family protein [Planococcus halocryophilus]ANU14525.1 potassium channel protein [Planococcus halocryophilus]EMF48168.1 Potassium channel protein [Planococcus halocryophilus Or1]
MISFILTLRRMLKAFFQLIKDKEFQVLLGLTAVILLSGTIFYSTVEGFTVVDALYFSVATLTTVGSATLEPVTDFGKIFTILYMITGIGVMLSLIVKVSLQMRNKKKQADLK